MASSQTEQIAASQQRQQVPKEWQLGFARDWSNDMLLSLSRDTEIDQVLRIWARWEWDYRKAFNVLIVLHPETGEFVQLVSDADLDAFEAAEGRVKAKAAEIMARRGGRA